MNRRRSTHRTGGLLLEVVLALTLVAGAMGILGAQLVNGLKLTSRGEQQTRAAELGDRLLALLELDQEMAERMFNERKVDGDFGDEYPGYLWQAWIEPTDLDGLGLLNLEIRYVENEADYGDLRQSQVVRSLHLLKANPGRIDLAADFGVDEEQLTQIVQQVPIPGFDPNALDPQMLAALDPAMLLEVLPVILNAIQQQFGDQLGGLSSDQLLALLANGGQIDGNLLARLNEIEDGAGDDIRGRINDAVGGGGKLPTGPGRVPTPPRTPGARGGSGGSDLGDLIRDRVNEGRGGRGGAGNRAGDAGNRGGNTGNRGGAGSLGDEIRNRVEQAGGNRGGTGGNRGSGAGNRAGSGNRGGGQGGSGGSSGSGSLADEIRNRVEQAGGGNRGGQTGGNRGGGNQPRMTIEDLQRLRNGGGRN